LSWRIPVVGAIAPINLGTDEAIETV
jgi:hypothetical protein